MEKQKLINLLRSYYSLVIDRDEAEKEIKELEKAKAADIIKTAPRPEVGSRSTGMTSDPTYTRTKELIETYDSQIGLQKLTYKRACEQLALINKLLNKLDKLTRTVVFWHYCKRHPWDWVARKIHYSSAQTRRIGNSAISFLVKK